jgi:hypothetical protein
LITPAVIRQNAGQFDRRIAYRYAFGADHCAQQAKSPAWRDPIPLTAFNADAGTANGATQGSVSHMEQALGWISRARLNR